MFSILPNLVTFFVGGNLLHGSIPASISNGSQLLQQLDLSNNSFSGSIPLLGNLPRVQILSLQMNQLVNNGDRGMDFITSLKNSTQLQVFSVAENFLTGKIPSSIGNLSRQLSLFVMTQNQIEGNIPEAIDNLDGLTLLALEDNSLSGKIPSAIGKIQNLQQIFLDKNMFFSSIPDSLGNLTELFHLSLSKNNLSGEIPSSLGNCQRLQFLDLSLNGLTGSIPKEILGIPNFGQVLNLSRNSLSGMLPVEISQLKMVQGIDISNNHLSGNIPVSLGYCSNLLVLDVANNSFQGPIPNSFSNLKGIEFIDLSSNHLTGEIPSSLKQLQFLQLLNLSMNQLQGEVPKGGIFSNSTVVSLIGNPKLCSGLAELKLPICRLPSKHRHLVNLTAKLIMGLSGGFAVFCFSLGLFLDFFRRKQVNVPPPAGVISFEGPHRLYTFHDLKTATNNFSSGNLLGEGSFSAVYRGIFNDGTVAAIKVFNMDQHGASKSFLAECAALRSVRHRNLVKIMSACSSLEFKALVLHFMAGGSLERWIYQTDALEEETSRLDLKARVAIAVDVASAMEYLHHDCVTPVVHCDLKPSNVLLDEDRVAHVGDFGIARMLLENPLESHLSSTLGLKGSIGYIAPEYSLGQAVSTRGDVYSFGILLLEMFTKKKPTHEMFIDGLNLQKWVDMALPNRIMEIIDLELMMVDESKSTEDCLVSILRTGLLCAVELPEERPSMREVSVMLRKIKDNLL